MTDVIYLEWLRLFDAEELQVLISGADAAIDVDDLRTYTQYVGGKSLGPPCPLSHQLQLVVG